MSLASHFEVASHQDPLAEIIVSLRTCELANTLSRTVVHLMPNVEHYVLPDVPQSGRLRRAISQMDVQPPPEHLLGDFVGTEIGGM